LMKRKWRPLLKYIENPSPTRAWFCVLKTSDVEERFDPRSRRWGRSSNLQAEGKGIDLLDDEHMAEKGKVLSEDGAAYLVEVVGDHLHPLENALEQVYLSVGAKKTIELSDIGGIVSEVKVSTIFDLTMPLAVGTLKRPSVFWSKFWNRRPFRSKKKRKLPR